MSARRRHHNPQTSDLQQEIKRLRRELADKDRLIQRQAEQIAEQQRQITDAEKQITDAEKQIADAEKQIADLEHQLALRKQNSTNSSKPRTNGAKRYLWAFVAARYVVYTVAATRSSQVLVDLLGKVFQGILCSDRFSAYLKYHCGPAQFCWAHLKRNLLGILELTKSSAVERFCRDALAQHARLFRLWHKFRSGQIDRNQLLLRSLPIQERIFALAERHLSSSHREVRNLARALFEHNERLFTFLEHEGVEPTNNSVERALRTAVQWRKICFGNRSAAGELATARLLTVAETCDIQKLNILAYLSAAIVCHRRRQPVASLLHR
jgi:transposase